MARGLTIRDREALLIARLDRELTRQALADLAGISYPTVWRAEQGKPIDESKAFALAKALGLIVSDVFEAASDAA